MAEPRSEAADAYASQLSIKEQQLTEGIEHRRVMLCAVESGAELERCEQMLESFGPLDVLEWRIAELQQRVHRVGSARPALFGGFYLGKVEDERELQDLTRRLDTARSLQTRARRLRTDPAAVKSEYEREISALEYRLADMRTRRARQERA